MPVDGDAADLRDASRGPDGSRIGSVAGGRATSASRASTGRPYVASAARRANSTAVAACATRDAGPPGRRPARPRPPLSRAAARAPRPVANALIPSVLCGCGAPTVGPSTARRLSSSAVQCTARTARVPPLRWRSSPARPPSNKPRTITATPPAEVCGPRLQGGVGHTVTPAVDKAADQATAGRSKAGRDGVDRACVSRDTTQMVRTAVADR